MPRTRRLAKRFRVTNGKRFRLKDIDPEDKGPIMSKAQAERWLIRGVAKLARLQEKLYAQDRGACC